MMSLQTSDEDYVSYSTWGADTVATVTERLKAVGQDGNCIKRRVGAAIVALDGTILAAAANGTPLGMRRCDSGGCVRCAVSNRFAHGVGYDLCICLHAEQAVLISALKHGIEVEGLLLVTSYQPCFMCAKLIVASGFSGVLYCEPWHVPEEQTQLPGLREDYASLWKQLPKGCQPWPP
jgi:dCMP deaminase